MKRIGRAGCIGLLVLLCSAVPGWAMGHGGFHGGGFHGHGFVHTRIFIGGGFGWWGWPGWWGPGWWGAPYPYYATSPAVVQQAPPAYSPAPQPEQYWYYCQESQAYYPYVKQCPQGWMKVVPQAQPPAP
jgi:hypothetical protein